MTKTANLTKRYNLKLGRLEKLEHDLPVIRNLKDRFEHTYILGPSGCGKSTLLARMALYDIDYGLACIFIDPKGETVHDIYNLLSPEDRERVIFYSYDNPSLVLNPLQKEGNDIYDLTDEFIEILDIVIKRVSPTNPTASDNMKEILRETIPLLKEEDRNIEKIYNFLRFKEERDKYFTQHYEGVRTSFWKKADQLVQGKPSNILGTADSLATRLNRLLKPDKFKKLFVGKNEYDIHAIARDKKIVLVDASGFTADKFFYVISMFVFGLQSYTRKRILDKYPIMFYFDEFARGISEGFKELLPWARSFQVGFTLAHQDFHQVDFKDKDILKTVISQCKTKIAFGQGEQECAKIMADNFNVPFKEFLEMDKHYAWMKIGNKKSFMKTYPLRKPDNFVDPYCGIDLNEQGKEKKPQEEGPKENINFLKHCWFQY